MFSGNICTDCFFYRLGVIEALEVEVVVWVGLTSVTYYLLFGRNGIFLCLRCIVKWLFNPRYVFPFQSSVKIATIPRQALLAMCISYDSRSKMYVFKKSGLENAP